MDSQNTKTDMRMITPHSVLAHFLSSLACIHTAEQDEPSAPLTTSLDSLFFGTETGQFSFEVPCLSLRSAFVGNGANAHRQPKPTPSELKNTAARQMSQSMLVTRATISSAPVTLLHNFCSSFQCLLDKRLQATAQALLVQASRQPFVKPEVENVLSSLSTLTDSTGALALNAASIDFALSEDVCPDPEVPCGDYTLDMRFQGVFKVIVQGKQETTVRVSTPGRVSGRVVCQQGGRLALQKAQIELDTSTLLESTLLRCRELVYNALSLMVANVLKDLGGEVTSSKKRVRIADGMELLCTAASTHPQESCLTKESPSCRTERKRSKSLHIAESFA